MKKKNKILLGASAVLAGAVTALFSEFGVVDLINKLVK